MTSPLDTAGTLEVVYYGTPVPRNPASLTFLGLIFDRIHFPNVYLPKQGFDFDAARAERDRITALPNRNYDTLVLMNMLAYLEMANTLKDVCYFTGEKGQMFGGVDKEATAEIVKQLDEALFGPPKENFIPTFIPGWHKSLGGDEYIDYPGPLHYPANALVYAARKGLPIVNDWPGLPVPGLGGLDAKNNAKLLSTVLALECASFMLPKIRLLNPLELLEARAELQPYLKPFRMELLRTAEKLNAAITGASSHEDVVSAARFLVETNVVPHLVELRAAAEKPAKPWLNRAFDVAKQMPELVTSYATMPVTMFGAKALGAIGGVLVDIADGQRTKQAARSGMYYLLKLQQLAEPAKKT